MTGASIVVPSFRGAAHLPGLLAALSGQGHTDFEVLVVIDGRVDDSPQIVANHGDDRIHAIVLEQNQGRVTALNTGFTQASGEILIRCDDDLKPGPTWLAAHVAAHDGRTNGVIGFCADVLPDSPYADAYGRPRIARMRAITAELSETAQAWRLWGGNVSVPRRLWEQIGPYDAAFTGYGWEDAEWGYRLHREGVPIVAVEGAEADHLAASTSVRTRATRAFDSAGARRIFTSLHPEAATDDEPPSSLWNTSVRRAADHLTRRRVERLADAADYALRYLPRAVSEKMVAFAVETASAAGARTDHRQPAHPEEGHTLS
ncbi:MAG: glycosyltransferase family 2 protein [Nostocoides sp.]